MQGLGLVTLEQCVYLEGSHACVSFHRWRGCPACMREAITLVTAARAESEVSGYYRLDSPATCERIHMACQDKFTEQVDVTGCVCVFSLCGVSCGLYDFIFHAECYNCTICLIHIFISFMTHIYTYTVGHPAYRKYYTIM